MNGIIKEKKITEKNEGKRMGHERKQIRASTASAKLRSREMVVALKLKVCLSFFSHPSKKLDFEHNNLYGFVKIISEGQISSGYSKAKFIQSRATRPYVLKCI